MQNASGDSQCHGLRSDFRISHSAFRRAFSLTEILIVIALIVLILAMALPAFNFISGSRSIDGAGNQINAYLGRARSDAVGLQEVRGVLFYLDPATDREMMAMVEQTSGKTVDPTTNSQVDYWLALVPDTEAVALPKGVGIELANDPTGVGYDRYIGFNTVPGTSASDPQAGDVILFDGYGRLVTPHWGLRMTDFTSASTGPLNLTGQLFYRNEYAASTNATGTDESMQQAAGSIAPRSSLAFVLFERNVAQEQYGSGFNSDLNYLANTAASSSEKNKETWLDNNSTPFCIDRYNGTLIKGQ